MRMSEIKQLMKNMESLNISQGLLICTKKDFLKGKTVEMFIKKL